MSYTYQQQQHHHHQQQSVMEETSDEESEDDSMMGDHELVNPHAQHQQQHHQEVDQVEDGLHDDDMYSDDGSESSIPDEFIDFSLTYALHTFLATVEGQASVVKGDSLVLLDDANSYWWLVRVLKTEDVGYIPAENIETPFERLARLNKHRNVDLAAATLAEKQQGEVKGRLVLKDVIRDKARGLRMNGSGALGAGANVDFDETQGIAQDGGRRVVFAPPTYVDHPGITWDEDEEDDDYECEDDDGEGDEQHDDDEEEEEEMDAEPRDVEQQVTPKSQAQHIRQESDDGMAWAEDAQRQQQQPVPQQPTPTPRIVTPASNNPFARESSLGTSQAGNSQSSLLDPAEAGGETRRITVTPAVASSASTLLPSAVMQQQTTHRNVSVSSVVSNVSTSASTRSGTPTSPDREDKKLKKAKKSNGGASGDESGGEEKKKKKGVLGSLFSRKKNKDKKGSKGPGSGAGIEGGRGGQSFDSEGRRDSEESLVSGSGNRGDSPGAPASASGVSDDRSLSTSTPQSQRNAQQSDVTSPQVSISPHGLRLQQLDKEIQQSYHHKYLSKSPSSEVMSTSDPAANVAQSIAAQRLARATGSPARPGSIILSPNPNGAPVLNVLRIFAGEHIRSEASFKTVLLNETTLSTDLIRQAVQRFHLHGHGEENVEYYLTVKDIDGDEQVLGDQEKPLAAFEEAVHKWRQEEGAGDLTSRLVKRSSVGSISSISSNLSMHPAITKLDMNDFSDDSAVKIYLNRRVAGLAQFGSYESNLTAEESEDEPQRILNPALTVGTSSAASPEKNSSPSARFTVQMVLHPEDTPDGRADEEQTRYFLLPRNATVVEAIEGGLERFGIKEGVVDGGDDVEDKVTKRRSLARVRYGLAVTYGTEEHALNPSSKVLDAYTEGQPNTRTVERMSAEQKRRSRDLSHSVGQAADILPSDPIFVLRRAAKLPPSPGSPGLGHFQKQQTLPPLAAGTPEAAEALRSGALSPQEIIAAQRAATRANQKALISAQANASQGVDVVLPDQGTLRSARLGVPGQEQVRYSYISGDGETIDISELIEQEWGNEDTKEVLAPPSLLRSTTGNSVYHTAPSTPDSGMNVPPLDEAGRSSTDILQGVLQRSRNEPEAQLQEKIHRVLEKVRAGAGARSLSSEDTGKRSVSPGGSGRPPLSPLPEGNVYAPSERSTSRQGDAPRSNSRQALAKMTSRHRQQPSIASILSDFSTDETGPSTSLTAATSMNPTPPVGASPMMRHNASPTPTPQTPVVYSDDFGVKQMLAVVQARALSAAPKEPERVELDAVGKAFYGEKPDMASTHPSVRQAFAPLQSRLEALDKELDELLGSMIAAH